MSENDKDPTINDNGPKTKSYCQPSPPTELPCIQLFFFLYTAASSADLRLVMRTHAGLGHRVLYT